MENEVAMLGSTELINLEEKYGAHNYHPLPVVLAKGEGVGESSTSTDMVC